MTSRASGQAEVLRWLSECQPGKTPVLWDGYGLDNPFSGIGRYALELYGRLKSTPHEPLVLDSGRLDFPAVNRVPMPSFCLGRTVGEIKPIWCRRVGSFLSGVLKKNHAFIYHGLSNLNLPSGFPKRRSPRFVLTVHDVIPLIDRDLVSGAYRQQLSWMLNRVVRQADAIVVVSQWSKKMLENKHPEATGKVHVIPNGLMPWSHQEILPRRKKEIGLSLLTVGRNEPYKRLYFLIDMLKYLPRSTQVTIVTDPKGAKFLREYAEVSLCTSQTSILSGLGAMDIQKCYSLADVYVHPSLYEGFGLPLSEAVSFGKPVVFTSGSSIEERMTHKVSESLSSDAKPEEWAEKVLLCARKSEEEDWVQNVHAFLEAHPTWDEAAEKLMSVYQFLG